MSGIDHDRFVRILSRCVEIAEAPAQAKEISSVFKQAAEAPIKGFLAAAEAVASAKTASAKASREAAQALLRLDRPYAVARVAVMAVLPDTVLPSTLKARPTDTDKFNAIERLFEIVGKHSGEAWADDLLAGEFGQRAPATMKALKDAIAADSVLGKVKAKLAEAHAPAHAAYQDFKRLVRNAFGSSSKEYRRIHVRASGGDGDDEDGGAEGAPPQVLGGSHAHGAPAQQRNPVE